MVAANAVHCFPSLILGYRVWNYVSAVFWGGITRDGEDRWCQQLCEWPDLCSALSSGLSLYKEAEQTKRLCSQLRMWLFIMPSLTS